DGLTALAGSPRLASLTRLALFVDTLGPEDCRALAHNLRPGLLHLSLTGNSTPFDGLAEALASCPQLRQLQSLSLTDTKLSVRNCEALATSRHLAELRYLSLCGVNRYGQEEGGPEGDAALQALTAGPGLPRLELLELSSCGITGLGLSRWSLGDPGGVA